MQGKIRVVLADDHPVFRDGLARCLSEAHDIDVVGLAADGEDAAAQTLRLRPDLVLLDVSMPRGGGIGALRRIHQMDSPPAVAMLTASATDDTLVDAANLGANGYILKGVGGEELLELVRRLASGGYYVSPSLSGRLLVAARRSVQTAEAASRLDGLTGREAEVLKLVAQGLGNRKAGVALGLQENTVKHHVSSILQKLRVRTRNAAAKLARRHLG